MWQTSAGSVPCKARVVQAVGTLGPSQLWYNGHSRGRLHGVSAHEVAGEGIEAAQG